MHSIRYSCAMASLQLTTCSSTPGSTNCTYTQTHMTHLTVCTSPQYLHGLTTCSSTPGSTNCTYTQTHMTHLTVCTSPQYLHGLTTCSSTPGSTNCTYTQTHMTHLTVCTSPQYLHGRQVSAASARLLYYLFNPMSKSSDYDNLRQALQTVLISHKDN